MTDLWQTWGITDSSGNVLVVVSTFLLGKKEFEVDNKRA